MSLFEVAVKLFGASSLTATLHTSKRTGRPRNVELAVLESTPTLSLWSTMQWGGGFVAPLRRVARTQFVRQTDRQGIDREASIRLKKL